LGVQQSRASA